MSRKRNIEKEMFQPTTESINSLTIDDVTGQAVAMDCMKVRTKLEVGSFSRS